MDVSSLFFPPKRKGPHDREKEKRRRNAYIAHHRFFVDLGLKVLENGRIDHFGYEDWESMYMSGIVCCVLKKTNEVVDVVSFFSLLGAGKQGERLVGSFAV